MAETSFNLTPPSPHGSDAEFKITRSIEMPHSIPSSVHGNQEEAAQPPPIPLLAMSHKSSKATSSAATSKAAVPVPQTRPVKSAAAPSGTPTFFEVCDAPPCPPDTLASQSFKSGVELAKAFLQTKPGVEAVKKVRGARSVRPATLAIQGDPLKGFTDDMLEILVLNLKTLPLDSASCQSRWFFNKQSAIAKGVAANSRVLARKENSAMSFAAVTSLLPVGLTAKAIASTVTYQRYCHEVLLHLSADEDDSDWRFAYAKGFYSGLHFVAASKFMVSCWRAAVTLCTESKDSGLARTPNFLYLRMTVDFKPEDIPTVKGFITYYLKRFHSTVVIDWKDMKTLTQNVSAFCSEAAKLISQRRKVINPNGSPGNKIGWDNFEIVPFDDDTFDDQQEAPDWADE
jgi:hypothetical protein